MPPVFNKHQSLASKSYHCSGRSLIFLDSMDQIPYKCSDCTPGDNLQVANYGYYKVGKH
ncbi:hypothetical protein RP20_CCG007067 [Aedes albopictus]|nr:hypothetical protein RP20_CCG007067 [Aedes albopictus]